ncbi:MAG: OmpA family protein [bacterium]
MKSKLYIICIILMSVFGTTHASFVNRADNWEETNWQDAQESDQCTLIHSIPGFGFVRFSYSDRERLNLDFIALEWPAQQGLALLQSEVTAWESIKEPKELAELKVTKTGMPFHFKRPHALRALYELEKGRLLKLYFNDFSDGTDTAVVEVSPIRFHEPLQKFRACTATLETVADKEKAQMATMDQSIHFSTNSSELTEDATKLLKEYSDKYLKLKNKLPIVVQAHADERGTDLYNNALSLARAKQVKSYLQQCGVPEKQIKVEFFGEKTPLVKQSTSEAWRQNRRAIITIPKAKESSVTSTQKSASAK